MVVGRGAGTLQSPQVVTHHSPLVTSSEAGIFQQLADGKFKVVHAEWFEGQALEASTSEGEALPARL
ncbi:MAG TPA: hypothetical protein DCE44_20720 [Verrucomicrobiales bacterium]|nr:hypothetical protein [Verrucomicrobiales bacterium]